MEDLPQDAVDRLHRVTKLLRTQRTLPAKLEAAVDLAKRTVPNCHSAGIILLIDGEPTSVAVTDRLAVEVDLVQYRNGEGPCLEAIDSASPIRIDILSRDGRFIRFAPGAIDHEIESVLSIPLMCGGRAAGALNLYSHLPNAFDAASEEAARPVAEYAAEAIGTSPLYAFALDMVEGLVETMESRALINQAVGVIMAGEKRTDEDALQRLRELALASGKPLRAVAQSVLDERPVAGQAADADLTVRADGATERDRP